MLIGIPPFYNKEQNYDLMYLHIREKEVNFGTKIKLSDEVKDIIKKVKNIISLGFDIQL